jgi:hypothetical protein
MTLQMEAEAASRLVVEYWKLLRSYERTAGELSEAKASKVQAQIRYSSQRLDQVLTDWGIRLVCFDGELFSPQLPLSAVNAEDLEGCEQAIVERTLEPTLLHDGTVLHRGKVLLKGA